jgi:muramoyltetrapeptide carboxypeptidase
MNRKYFLSSVVSTVATMQLRGSDRKISGVFEEEAQLTVPPALKKGDIIGVTSPAGYITLEEMQPAISKMEEWGYRVKLGENIGKRDFTFGGTDAERLFELQSMLDDKSIKAIMCARGGYGVVRIIDQLDFKLFKAHPKWVIGFSDITVLHSHIHRHAHTATIHSKMCNSFPVDWALAELDQKKSIESIHQCLAGEKLMYECQANTSNKKGTGNGQLVGGNIKTLESLSGTASDINTKNKILFVEDTGEYLYSIDRMFWNLKRTGKMAGLQGLIIGGFKIRKDDEGEEFGKSLEQIVLEKVREYNYPVCFNFPVGHQKYNMALKCGVVHKLEVGDMAVKLSER